MDPKKRPMKMRITFPLVSAFALLLSISGLSQGTFTSAAAGPNNWTASGSWTLSSGSDADGVPDSDDNVIIANGHTIQINGGAACFNLTLNGSGIITFTSNNTLAVGGGLTMDGSSQIIASADNVGRVLTVAGNFFVPNTATNARIGNATANPTVTISGTSDIAGTFSLLTLARVKRFDGLVTVSGSWTSTTVTTSSNLEFRNGLSVGGTFVGGGATFNTNSQALGGNGSISFGNIVTVTGVTLTNDNTSTVTISGTGAAQLAGTGSFRAGSNSTLNYAGSTLTVTTADFTTNTPNTINYTGATPTLRAVNYNNLSFTGSTSASLATQSISGNLTVTTGAFSSSGTLTFNGNSTQTISGSTGSVTLTTLLLANSPSSTASLTIDRNVTINTSLNFNTSNDRLVTISSNGNLTMGSSATFSNVDAGSYVQQDGLSGANGNLIITTTNSLTGPWINSIPVGTSAGGLTPIDLGATTLSGVAPTNGATLSAKVVYQGNNQGQLRRLIRIAVAGNSNATTFSNGTFTYNSTTDISSGDAEVNYSTGWYLPIPNGSWTTTAVTNNFASDSWTVTSASLGNSTNYFTLGTANAYPNVWYTYQSGVWSDYLNWTLDPSGTTLTNTLELPPVPGDRIVILNGITITNDVNTQTTGTCEIRAGGTLDMSNTTGNTLGTVSGEGLLRIKGATLPDGTYTSFVSSTGGTIEYYDIGGTLDGSETTTYNKLKMTNSTGSNITYVMTSNLTVNSTFDITASGAGTVKWQINDASATQRTISLLGDLTVGSGGKIGVGSGSPVSPHALTMAANITNNGEIKFYDDTDTGFTAGTYLNSSSFFYLNPQNNSVNVTYSNTGDNTIDCQGVTHFYRLIVNKGTGPGAILTVNSSADGNFRLYGPADDMTSPSLSLLNGTLKLTGAMSLGFFCLDNSDFPIPSSAGLWLNGAGVNVTVTDQTTATGFNYNTFLDGVLRITDGTYNSGRAPGLIAGDEGSLIMEGGTLNVWQIRGESPSSGNFNYQQTGGTVNVAYGFAVGGGNNSGSYARFSLGSPTATFAMSGGTLNIAKPNGGSGGKGIVIGSGAGFYNVTGGTVNIVTGRESAGGSGLQDFLVNSTAPFYNVNIIRENVDANNVILETNGLTVLNDLTISNSSNTLFPTLNCNNLNVKIGGNFEIQSGTTFTPGTDTVTFNGSGAQQWTYAGTITSLNHVVVNKPSGTLTLTSAGTLPNIAGGLTITSGTIADGGETINVTGSTMSNSGTHTSSGSGEIVVSAATNIGGSNGTFGNLTITNNATVATAGNQTVTNDLRLTAANTALNISSFSLTVLGNIYSAASPSTSATFSNNKKIFSDGLSNSGGLTRKATSATDLLFPLGTSGIYTPVTINATATTAGNIKVINVTGEHPNVTTANLSVLYYWRVSSTGFSGLGTVTHKTYTFSSSTKNGTLTNYRAARYDRAANTWAYGAVYNATGTTVIPNFATGDGTWTGALGYQIDGEYTCGEAGGFGTFNVYYSNQSGPWNVNSTWSTVSVGGGAASSNPTSCSNCPVIIGNGVLNHTVTIDANNRQSGSMAIATGSTLDVASFTGLDFNTINNVNGFGTIRLSTNTFPGGAFTNFLGSTGGTVEYYGGTKTLNTTTADGISLLTYYNLKFSPDANADISLPAGNVTIYNDLTITGINSTTSRVLNYTVSATNRAISIGGALNITTGKLYINSNARLNFSVTGLTTIGSNGFFQLDGTGTKTHTFTTTAGITNNGTLDFLAGANVMNLSFIGASNAVFSGTGSGDINVVAVDKGINSTYSVEMTMSTVTAPSTAWLTLTNGTFDFNNGGTFSLRTSGNFTIGATTKLKATSGTLNVLSGGTGDLFLNGELEVAGGTVTVANGTNGNDIEYANTGIPKITVSGGSLTVNGSIRRSSTSTVGALNYTQTGGAVTVRGHSALATRGVFEIDNTGSNFTLTGNSTLTIERDSDGSSYADLFLNPETSNVSATSTITVGINTEATNNMRIDIKPAIGNFTVAGGGTAQTATMYNNPLVVQGTLSVVTPATLVTQNLDVTVAGDFACSGTYTGGTNTTTFNGSGAQACTLSSTSAFNNVTVNKSAGTATLSGTSPSLNNLNILSGILDVGALNLAVNGNIVNNSTQDASGGGYIIMASNAVSHSITSDNGIFTNLRLANSGTFPATQTINVTGDLTIKGNLDFNTTSTNVYFFIGGSELYLTEAATISNSGTNRFIRTNGVSSDLGVTRDWPAGANTFTYPVGTLTNYTPVIFTGLSVSTSGELNIIPVASAHPTQESASSLVLLSYYWIVNKDNSLAHDATGSLVFQAPTALIAGAGGTLQGAYLDVLGLDGTNGWNTPIGTMNAGVASLTITGTLDTQFPGPGDRFDYTFGDPSRLPSPIAFVYSRFADADMVTNPTDVDDLAIGGDWTDVNSWTNSSTGFGAPLVSIPTNKPVFILSNARINMNSNSRTSFLCFIAANGLLNNSSGTIGHSIGILSGTGSLRTSTPTLPAGNFTNFVSATGGTIEYIAPMTMNGLRSTYNNIRIYFDGVTPGTVTMTSGLDLTLNGDMTIDASATLNTSNRDITLAGDWTTNGTFTQGTGHITFNGSSNQTLAGAAAKSFNTLEVDKTAGNLILGGTGNTTVTGTLTLTSRHVVANTANKLALGTATVNHTNVLGGAAPSFLVGPVTRTIAAGGGTWEAPVGRSSGSVYRPVILTNVAGNNEWEFEYVGNDPTDNGFSNDDIEAGLGSVSEFEYWVVTRGTTAGGDDADVTLSYSTGSYSGVSIEGPGTLADLRVARWDGAEWAMPPAATSNVHVSGDDITGRVRAEGVTAFSPLTLASTVPGSPLPVELLYFTGKIVEQGVQLDWKTATEIDNDYFTIEKATGGEKFAELTKVAGAGNSILPLKYQFIDRQLNYGITYYRLKQTDFSGKSETFKVISVDYRGDGQVFITVYPNPASGNELTIELGGLKEVTKVPVTITDQVGKVVFVGAMEIEGKTFSEERKLPIDTLQSGVYFIKVGNFVKRVVITR